MEKTATPVPDTEKETAAEETNVNVAASDVSAEDTADGKVDGLIPDNVSFKEESNDVKDLIDPEKKALDQLKELIVAALANNELSKPSLSPPMTLDKTEEKTTEEKTTEEFVQPLKELDREKEAETVELDPCLLPVDEKEEEPNNATVEKEEKPTGSIRLAVALAEEMKEEEDALKTVQAAEEAASSGATSDQVAVDAEKEVVEKAKPLPSRPEPEQVFIWGNPLIGGEKSDTILLKFLRARDFKVKEALTMIKNTIIWRKEFNIDTLLNEDLAIPELEKVVFTHGQDRDGHPVCYNVYGEFQNKSLYQKTFGDEEKRRVFLRWRVQVLENDIQEKLNFSPEGVCTMVQVTDLKNSPGPGKKELRQATKQALSLLQDNYPEFVAKQVCWLLVS